MKTTTNARFQLLRQMNLYCIMNKDLLTTGQHIDQHLDIHKIIVIQMMYMPSLIVLQHVAGLHNSLIKKYCVNDKTMFNCREITLQPCPVRKK